MRLMGGVLVMAAAIPGLAEAPPDFVLPTQGCPMAHCDGRLSDLANSPVPRGDVAVVWRQDVDRGVLSGLGCSSNGVIAACAFNDTAGENLVAYDYEGRRLWSSGGLLNATAWTSAPMVGVDGSVIAADDTRVVRFDPQGSVVWDTPTPGGRPISPVLSDDGLLVIATWRGPLSAYDLATGERLARHTIRKLGASGPSFSTTNTPCVRGNRIYVVAEQDGLNLVHAARLVALDVDRTGFRVAWNVEFGAPSGTSPLIIGDVVYFAGSHPTTGFRSPAEPTIFAVRDRGDRGEVMWTRRVEDGRAVLASLAQDPRGGMWYFPVGDPHVIRIAEADGGEVERISIDDLVARPGVHGPGSAITIGGTPAEPVLLVSAKTYLGNSFVVAVDLTARALSWKALIAPLSSVNRRSTSGQFPILMGDRGPRVVFSSWDMGVFAVGELAPAPER